jgi:hypothetical protein
LARGDENKVAEAGKDQQSSLSHTIFSIEIIHKVIQRYSNKVNMKSSQINLVNLAGM